MPANMHTITVLHTKPLIILTIVSSCPASLVETKSNRTLFHLIMVFFVESLIACAVFTLFVFLMSRNPIKSIFNYPPAIIERCDKLGLVDASNKPGGVGFYVKKVTAMAVFGVLLGLLVKYVNGCTSFWCGALTAYALWMVVNWFDALVLDCLWFCHDKHFVIPGTEDMTDAYHDYWFHIKGALIGMVLGIPAALMAGIIVIV